MGSDSPISTPRPSRSGIFISAGAIAFVLAALPIVERGCSWLDERDRAARAAAHAEAEKEERLYKRLEDLERWQCVQGWRPPETRDAGRVCPAKER